MMVLHTTLISLLAAVGAWALTGDTQCDGSMCVSAVVQSNSTVQYTLTVKQPQVGWMAMGFGTRMINSPIVLMWRNSANGEAVLSQRQTSVYVMPQPVTSPDRVASALQYKTSATSSETSLSFEIPSTSETRQNVIWAYCLTAPGTPSDPNSDITQHDEMGTFRLNLANTLDSNGDSNGSDEQIGVDPDDTISLPPLTSREMMLVAHGAIMTVAFLFILPFGALFVRLTRTWIPGKFWFATHWIFQWPLAGALITVGFALGVSAVQQVQKPHWSSDHKKWGLAIVVLYVVQCCLGGIIHFIKEKRRIRRPPQNYIHAMLGLFIIGSAFAQVRNGFRDEWPTQVGRTVSSGANSAWIAWAVIVPLFYVAGLAFLPRQYKQERQARDEDLTEMTKRRSDEA